MDRRSWLWRRKSSEKGPGETESSGSASSYSERCSDEQEALRASPNNASPNHTQSPEVSSHATGSDVHETMKSLTEKLSAALLNISVKEDLVKQHMKVAEEAVSGWEKAETELVALKQQLEAGLQKNSALEDRICHLDGALKESVRQLRHYREEQEQKVHDVLMKKTHEWESEKFELENRLNEFQVQLEAAKAEAAISVDHGLWSKLEAAEKENVALHVELLTRSEDLQMRTLEKELSTRVAETASKQHLESIKKVAKLEAECRRLRAVARRTSSYNDHKPITNSVCVESLTDSQSDSGERLFGVDNEPSCSDSWASALIAELDQFRNDKASVRKLAASSEIDLMDDFLEMERLVAMPETDRGNSSFGPESESNNGLSSDSPLKSQLEAVRRQMAELEEKMEKMETEKVELQMTLDDTRNRLELSSNQLIVAEDKLVVLQRHLDSTNESKLVAMTGVVAAEENLKALEPQLVSAQLEVGQLREEVCTLEGEIEKEKAVSEEFAAKVEAVEALRKALECQLVTANFEVKKLRDKVDMLEGEVEEERTLSFEFAAKVEAVEGTRKALEYQLESANFEVRKLRQKVDMLQGEVEEERAVSAEFAAKVVSLEGTRKGLECHLESARLEVGKLHEKMVLLEDKVEEERSLSVEFSVKVEAAEAAKKASETQLQAAHMEVGKLRDKAGLLEEKVDEERAWSAQLAAKCQDLEDDPSRKKREGEVQRVTSLNRELKTKQDKELAFAAGKLADCQKTIASLGRQLKSLASFDNFMLEDEKAEPNGGPPDLTAGDAKKLHAGDFSTVDGSFLPNGKEWHPLPSSSSPSSFSEFARLKSLGAVDV